MNKILLFVFMIVFINILLFLIISDANVFMFNLKDFMREPWRYLTFQFFHTNLTHLIENTVGLAFAGFLTRELDIDFKIFAIVYFVSIFIVPIPMLILFHESTVAGNSVGIYGVLALAMIRGRKLIPQKITIPSFVFIIFSLSILKFISCGMCYEEFFKSDFFHFSGFVCGLSMSYVPVKKAKYILRGGER